MSKGGGKDARSVRAVCDVCAAQGDSAAVRKFEWIEERARSHARACVHACVLIMHVFDSVRVCGYALFVPVLLLVLLCLCAAHKRWYGHRQKIVELAH